MCVCTATLSGMRLGHHDGGSLVLININLLSAMNTIVIQHPANHTPLPRDDQLMYVREKS